MMQTIPIGKAFSMCGISMVCMVNHFKWCRLCFHCKIHSRVWFSLSIIYSYSDVIERCDYDGGWHPYAGMCYKYANSHATWFDAQATCEADKGNLAILNTNEKLNLYKEVVSCKDLSAAVWIGLSDTVGLYFI